MNFVALLWNNNEDGNIEPNHEVVNKEVIKWLDAGIIYPIFDN